MPATLETLFVCGTFNDQGGKPSKIGDSIGQIINPHTLLNGGSYQSLENIIDDIKAFKTIYWFANVPNDKPKLVKSIKEHHPSCVLVTSKRNDNQKYVVQELIAHALNNKSNLFLEFSSQQGMYFGRILDPLGNMFLDYDPTMEKVARTLIKRVQELHSFTRLPSKSTGPAIPTAGDETFFALVRQYADIFHNLIHASNCERLLGNLSFRCESGFPSCKYEDTILVSKRNVDKRNIGAESMVPIDARSLDEIHYLGNQKPSVDTPIQLRLYHAFPNATYMLHAHCYIEGAPFTKRIIPCGALEEVADILEAEPDITKSDFYMNLRGHGSIAFAKDIDTLRDLHYIARPIPELVENYTSDIITASKPLI